MTRKALWRFSIAAIIVGFAVFVDGLVLLFTDGLKTDASPILPVLGGMFSKTRSSGASLVVLGIAIVVLTLIGRWWLARKMPAEGTADVEAPEAVSSATPGPTVDRVALDRQPVDDQPVDRPSVDRETREPAAPA